ncbi:MAG: prenyltransferase, partial [Candidatus Bathyarchaeota archaeon]
FRMFLEIVKLGRLQFSIIGTLLFFFGALLAIVSGSPFNLSKFLLGYAIYFPANLAVSYSNDFFDSEVDYYGSPTPISGGSGVLIRNRDLQPLAKWLAILLMTLSVVFSLLATILYSLPGMFLLITIVGNLLGWFYSAPPLKLSYRGYGELVASILIGLMIPGISYFLLRGAIDRLYFIFALPAVLYGFAFILNVELPDRQADKIGNKKTLIVRTNHTYGIFLILLSYSLILMYFLMLSIRPPFISLNFLVLSSFSLLPLVAAVYQWIHRTEDRETTIKFVIYNILALISFLVILNCYLVYLALSIH